MSDDRRSRQPHRHVDNSVSGDAMLQSWHEMRNKLAELHTQNGDANLAEILERADRALRLVQGRTAK
jgi:hypothetical protein